MPESTEPVAASTKHGAGRALITVYAILAVGASARSLYELFVKFDQAPLAYSLSLVAAVVYCVITVALVKDTPTWRRVAFVCMVAELIGVLVVGTLSIVDPARVRGEVQRLVLVRPRLPVRPARAADPRPELPAHHPRPALTAGTTASAR